MRWGQTGELFDLLCLLCVSVYIHLFPLSSIVGKIYFIHTCILSWYKDILLMFLFAFCFTCRMWLTLFCSIAGGAALLYALYSWVIPSIVQYHPDLALLWHDRVVEQLLNTLTQSTRPQVGFFSAFSSQGQLCNSLIYHERRRVVRTTPT